MAPDHGPGSDRTYRRAGARGCRRFPDPDPGTLHFRSGPRYSGGHSDSWEHPGLGASLARLAIGFLFWFISQESFLLRFDLQTEREYAASIPAVGEIYEVRQNVFPICALMAMIGLMLGAGAGSFLDQPQPPRRRLPSLFAVLASLTGVLIMANSNNHTIISYLVMLAPRGCHQCAASSSDAGARLFGTVVEALECKPAFRGWQARPWRSCWPAISTALAAVCHGRRRGRRGFFALAIWRLAAALGLHVALVTIPGIHANLAEGFRSILGRTELGMIVCGFALFAAGMAARSLFPRPAEVRPLWLERVAAGIRWTILGIAIFWFLINASVSAPPDPGMPRVFGLVYVISEWIRGCGTFSPTPSSRTCSASLP